MILSKQVLSDQDRKKIRSDIYTKKFYRADKDGKIKFFSKYCVGRSILDLGCVDHNPENEKSALWLHGALRKVADKILGLDYYEEGIEYLANCGYNVVCSDAQNFNFPKKFESVTAGDLIEHVSNPGLMFTCVNRHLEVGGKFVVSTPNPWCWKYVAYFWTFNKMDKINQEHVAWYCPETLRLIGQRHGFSVVEIQFSSRRFWEKFIPLPRALRATTINLAYEKRVDV